MSKESEGTTRPPLVLFGRYGTNCHSHVARDDSHRLHVAEISEFRARKVNAKPYLIGYGTRSGKSAKQQEQKWIDICLDRPKNQPH